jgi:hypothetical protein
MPFIASPSEWVNTERSSAIAAPTTQCRDVFLTGLWFAQALLGIGSCMGGVWMLAAPIEQQASMMPWTSIYLEGLVRLLGAINLLGGMGLLLTLWTLRLLHSVGPELSVAAAAGCASLHIAAISFHIARGETHVILLNLSVLALSLFVLWGRAWMRPRIMS